MSQTLGTMRRVKPKDVWTNEEEFSRWLAFEEGMSILSEAVGLELGGTGVEVDAGQYRADVVGYDFSDADHSRTVVVENQLNPSDHRHLGQLVTYCAMLEADVGVWIAKRFSDEHLQAVYLLNYPEDRLVDYYCVQLSVSRIDDSPPAPHFVTLEGPEGWRPREGKAARARTDEGVREKFWSLLDEKLANQGMSQTIPGRNVGYRRFDIGFPGVSIYLDRDRVWNRVGLRIYRTHRGVSTGWEFYRRLQSERSAIGREIGEPVAWRRPNDRLNAVEVSAESHLHDESKWDGEVDWTIERIKTLRDVLRPRLGEPLTR